MKRKEDSFHLGVKALIANQEGKLLLLKRNHPVKKLYWDIPGGRLQKGETQMDTLRREVKEETGLDLHGSPSSFMMTMTDIRIPIPEGDVGLIFSIFFVQLSTLFQPVLSNEHVHFEWCSPLEASKKLKSNYPGDFVEKISQLKTHE